MEVGDEIHRTSCAGHTLSIINYYSDDLSSHGERIEKIHLLIFLWSWLAIRRAVENLSIAQFTLNCLKIDNLRN